MNALFADLSTGFSVYDIPVVLAQCFVALSMTFLLKRIYLKQYSQHGDTRYFLPVSLLAVAAGIIAKTGLQGSVLAMGFLILCGNFFSSESGSVKFYLVSITLFSVLCGFSQVPLAMIVYVVFILFLFFKRSQ